MRSYIEPCGFAGMEACDVFSSEGVPSHEAGFCLPSIDSRKAISASGPVRTWPNPGLALLARGQAGPGPGPEKGGPALKGQGQGQQKEVGPGPDRPMDSVVLCLTPCTVYKEEPCCTAVAVRAEGCAVDAAVDRVATGIEDKVVVVVIGGHSVTIESVAGTAAARVICEAAGINAVVVENIASGIVYKFPIDDVAARVVCKAAGINAVVVENVASGIVNNVVAADTLSCVCRRRTVAVAACAIAVVGGIVIAAYGVIISTVVTVV
jgi:hypothetical protein